MTCPGLPAGGPSLNNPRLASSRGPTHRWEVWLSLGFLIFFCLLRDFPISLSTLRLLPVPLSLNPSLLPIYKKTSMWPSMTMSPSVLHSLFPFLTKTLTQLLSLKFSLLVTLLRLLHPDLSWTPFCHDRDFLFLSLLRLTSPCLNHDSYFLSSLGLIFLSPLTNTYFFQNARWNTLSFLVS